MLIIAVILVPGRLAGGTMSTVAEKAARTAHLTDAAFVWGIPAIGFLLLTAILVGYGIWRRRLRKRLQGLALADVWDR